MKDNLLEPGDQVIALVRHPFSAFIEKGEIFTVNSVSEDGCATSNGWWIPREANSFDGKISIYKAVKPQKARKNKTKAFVLK